MHFQIPTPLLNEDLKLLISNGGDDENDENDDAYVPDDGEIRDEYTDDIHGTVALCNVVHNDRKGRL